MVHDCNTTEMAEIRDSNDSQSESGNSDIARTILSSSSYEYIDPEGGAQKVVPPSNRISLSPRTKQTDRIPPARITTTTIMKTIFGLETFTGKLQYFLYNNGLYTILACKFVGLYKLRIYRLFNIIIIIINIYFLSVISYFKGVAVVIVSQCPLERSVHAVVK